MTAEQQSRMHQEHLLASRLRGQVPQQAESRILPLNWVRVAGIVAASTEKAQEFWRTLRAFRRIMGGMDTCFHSMELNGPRPEDQRRILCGETMNNAKRLNTCLVCGHRLLANEGFPLESPRVLRHRNCSKQRLVSELRERADTLGLTSLDLLTRRLAELQDRILRALGEVSFEQFQTAEPAGCLHLFLSGSDLKVRVVFGRHVQSEAIYREALMTPGELQQQKTRLLLRIGEQTRARPGSMHTGPTQRQLADWLIVADWLKQAEDHWSGRKKEEIAREVLANERVQFKILNSSGMDIDLASRPFASNFAKLEPIAQRILSAEDPESSGRVTRTIGDPAEVI
jgi:hypothetical protein